MKYLVIINDDERVGNGDESTVADVEYEAGELLRSGYFEIESVRVLTTSEY